MAEEGLPTTYALIYNFLKKHSHAKAAAAVKKAAKEASVVILKDNPEESGQDDLNQIVKAWKEKKFKQQAETSSSEDSDSDSESSSQSDSSDTGSSNTSSSSSSASEGRSSHPTKAKAKANGKLSNTSKTNSSSETSDSDSSSQSSSESETERKPGIGAKPKVNSKPPASKPHPPPKSKGSSSSDSDSSDSTSSEEESSSSDTTSENKRVSKKSTAVTNVVSEVKITKKRRLSDSGQAKITAIDEDVNTPAQDSKQNGKSQGKDTPAKSDNKKPRKSNTPFQRIKQEDVVFHDHRLKDNTYMARGGAANDYGAKANQDLIVTRGDGFRKAKNKKKRGSYRGGEITLESHSIKFT